MTDQPITEVIIDTHGPTITVRGPVSAHDAATLAKNLFDHVAQRYPAPRDHLGSGAAFTSDRRDTADAQPSSMHWAPGPYPIQPPGCPE